MASVRIARCGAVATVLLALTGCGGNYAPQEDTARASGPLRDQRLESDDSIFGEGGLGLSTFTGEDGPGDSLPVNKYLWRAALDTLSFLPLASTDPFTGVIASDWSSTPEAPGERFRVTAYLTRPALEASSLKVAVFRESRNADGLWVPQQVSPETAAKLETAILTRARQIRIAEIEGEDTDAG